MKTQTKEEKKCCEWCYHQCGGNRGDLYYCRCHPKKLPVDYEGAFYEDGSQDPPKEEKNEDEEQTLYMG